jgi:dolichyl-diphosphooligosaccharide--protein glycosyltransferase
VATRNQKIEAGVIAGIIILSFVLSYGIRTQTLNYGMEIDEFDPYFNFRASTYLHENGLDAYMNWHDELSWYPTGRDVFESSQVMLHVTAVTLYQPFQDMMSLKDFVIYFPAVIGSLTVAPIFLLVRRITNTRVGALAALFFAVSVPFIQRGMAGWFKSEPLGLFYGAFGVYFFVSGVMNIFEGQKKGGIIKLIAAGITLACGLSAWGGVVFFFLPILAWLLMIPGMKGKIIEGLGLKDKQILEGAGYHIKSFVIGTLGFAGGLFLVSSLFARSGAIVGNYVGLSIFLVIGFIIFEHIMNTKFKWSYKKSLVVFAGAVIAFALVATSTDVGSMVYGCPDTNKCAILNLPFDRYVKVLIPFDTEQTSLSKSVAEHQIPDITHVFSRTVFLFLFMPIGFVAIARKQVPPLPATFALTISVMAMYVGMSYVRLELFMSLGMIIMASLGIMFLFKKFAEENNGIYKSERQLKARKTRGYAIIIMLLVMMMFPAVMNWAIMMDRPALILYGGSMVGTPTNDWLDTLEWVKNNTPEDAKIMAWWDYGYWIQTMANRTTYMDNGAYMTDRIVDNANILTDEPYSAVERLQEKDVDYVMFYVVGQKSGEYVQFGLGGDVAKMHWILTIGERDRNQYYDRFNNLNNNFYYNTLYGSMIPFVQRAEVIDSSVLMPQASNPIAPWEGTENQDIDLETINPQTGQYYEYPWMKFELKDTAGMRMVYASDGIQNPPEEGTFHGVFVYQVPVKGVTVE